MRKSKNEKRFMPNLPASEEQRLEPQEKRPKNARKKTQEKAQKAFEAREKRQFGGLSGMEKKRSCPSRVPQAGPTDKMRMGARAPAAASSPGVAVQTVSVPLIRPQEDAKTPARRVMVDAASIEASARKWGVHQQSAEEGRNAQGGRKKLAGGPASPPGTMASSSSSGPITKDTLISEIVLEYPQLTELLMAIGLHCIGCQLSSYDTLETGCALHGMDETAVEELVKRMNEKLRAEAAGAKQV